MPVPSDNSLSNLSTTPGSNSPSGGENISTTDDYLRFIQAALKAGLTNNGNAITTAGSVAIPSAGLTARLLGNGTVTALTGGYDGRLLLVQIEGSITFTHSASLQCPGGVSLVVTSGDLLLVERRGSVWYLYNSGHGVAAALARGIASASGSISVPGNQANTVIPLSIVDGVGEWTAASNGMQCQVTGAYEIRAQVIQTVDVANQSDQGYFSVMIAVDGIIVAEDILPLHNNCAITITPICHRLAFGITAGQIVNVLARSRQQGSATATCYVQARRW